jgi:hypothetical protein
MRSSFSAEHRLCKMMRASMLWTQKQARNIPLAMLAAVSLEKNVRGLVKVEGDIWDPV